MKLAILAPPARAEGIKAILADYRHDGTVSDSIARLISLVHQQQPAAVIVASGVENAAYAPLAQVYAQGCKIIALAYPADPDAKTLATVAGALGGAVLYPDEATGGVNPEQVMAALSTLTGQPPAWLQEATADPLLTLAISETLKAGGQYSSRLLADRLHCDEKVARSLAQRVSQLPGAMPPRAPNPGVLVLPGASAEAGGICAWLQGVLAASGVQPGKPRQRSRKTA